MSYSDRLDTITEKYQTSFGKLDASELNWKASANKWSIAQNIDHIITINQSYYPIFDSVHNGTLKLAFISKFGFMVNWFGDIILKSVNPDRNKKIKTFDIW